MMEESLWSWSIKMSKDTRKLTEDIIDLGKLVIVAVIMIVVVTILMEQEHLKD